MMFLLEGRLKNALTLTSSDMLIDTRGKHLGKTMIYVLIVSSISSRPVRPCPGLGVYIVI